MSKRTEINTIWLFIALAVLLLHLPTFFIEHVEGDELVYLGLANKMSWGFSNYSTQEILSVSEFPARLYRANLFLHPPLFPYLLKILSIIGNPVAFGLLFNALVHFLICVFVQKTLQLFKLADQIIYTAVVVTLFCPVITAASIKLHIDALAGLLLLTTCYYLLKGSIYQATSKSWPIAGVLFGLALNSKFTALVTLPAFCVYFYFHFSTLNPQSDGRRLNATLKSKDAQRAVLIALVIGLPHYARLIFEYGTVFPYHLLTHDRPTGIFLQRIMARGRFQSLTYLFALVPFVTYVLQPAFFKNFYRQFKAHDLSGYPTFFLLMIVAPMFIFYFNTERYWAIFLPILYVSLSIYVSKNHVITQNHRVLVFAGIASMIMSTFYQSAIAPRNDIVVPSIVLLVPPLAQIYN